MGAVAVAGVAHVPDSLPLVHLLAHCHIHIPQVGVEGIPAAGMLQLDVIAVAVGAGGPLVVAVTDGHGHHPARRMGGDAVGDMGGAVQAHHIQSLVLATKLLGDVYVLSL